MKGVGERRDESCAERESGGNFYLRRERRLDSIEYKRGVGSERRGGGKKQGEERKKREREGVMKEGVARKKWKREKEEGERRQPVFLIPIESEQRERRLAEKKREKKK